MKLRQKISGTKITLKIKIKNEKSKQRKKYKMISKIVKDKINKAHSVDDKNKKVK